MAYRHGIEVDRQPFSVALPQGETSGVPVVFGTAQSNLASNPVSSLNKPLLIRNPREARELVGFSTDFDFTLNQAIDAAFNELKISPIVVVNVLDVMTHKESETTTVNLTTGEAVINDTRALLDTVEVEELTADTDFIVSRDPRNRLVVSLLNPDAVADASSVEVTYDRIDPSLVTDEDLVGSYDPVTNVYKGIELLTQVYPKYQLIPNIISAPGFSTSAVVGAALTAKADLINGILNAFVLLDVEGETRQEALAEKDEAGYDSGKSTVLWPKIVVASKKYWYSAYMSAVIAQLDSVNDNVPFKSPSNKSIRINGLETPGGQELFQDKTHGNELNAKGIVTAINVGGWRTWGNETAAFDSTLEEIDIADLYISNRRMFDWWSNSFILSYFSKVDNPTDFRLIEQLVDDENIRANGFQAAGQIAGARISFSQDENPIESILAGEIVFDQEIAFYPPAKHIKNRLSFNPTILNDALFGGA